MYKALCHCYFKCGPRKAAIASPGGLLKIQTLRLHLKYAESDFLCNKIPQEICMHIQVLETLLCASAQLLPQESLQDSFNIKSFDAASYTQTKLIYTELSSHRFS